MTIPEQSAGREEQVEWVEKPEPEAAGRLRAAGYGRLSALLARRGARTEAEAESFLRPHRRDLHDPFLLRGMEEAVERVLAVCSDRGTVAIVGDYDVDGVTGCALLTAVLRSLDAEVVPILPDRLKEGFGFRVVHVEKAKSAGAALIVTVDCGATSHEAVEEAIRQDMNVVVTDHHSAGGGLPTRAIQVNPRLNPRQDGRDRPLRDLCGVGLAFKLAVAVLGRSGRDVPLASLLRVACLGTIADVVPLVGENRVIAALGLQALPESPSPGLRALMRVALPRRRASDGRVRRVSSADVAFRLGPRLNAAGRLKSAKLALDLLLTRDRLKAYRLARELDDLNRERQATERKVVREARTLLARGVLLARDGDKAGRLAKKLDDLNRERQATEREVVREAKALLTDGRRPGILMAWNEEWHGEWHRGVLGIAAGRLAREFHRPVVLLEVDGASAVGSGRSISGVDLYSFMAGFRGRMERFGGHPQAIGLTVEVSELEALKEDMEAAADWPSELLVRRREYELDLAPEQVGPDLLGQLERLEPHGEANRRPLIRLHPLERIGRVLKFGNDHLKLQVRRAGSRGSESSRSVQLLGWGWGRREEMFDGSFEVLGALEWDDYSRGPVVRIEDVRPIAEDP